MVGQKFGAATAAMVVGVAVLAGCASGGSDADGTTTTRAASATADGATSTTRSLDDAPSSDDAFPDGLRDVRYCEILLLRKPKGSFEAEVWNTLGLNDCPPDQWDALDATAIAKDRDALAAIKNGPRYWTLDAIISDIRAGAPETAFGGLDMFQAATVALGDELPDQSPYTPAAVRRETIFRFRAGTEVHELVGPDGARSIMQSYSQIVDPTLTMDQLDSLGDRLDLPDGWSYETRTLEEDVEVRSTDGIATVIQDDLKNSYQLIDEEQP